MRDEVRVRVGSDEAGVVGDVECASGSFVAIFANCSSNVGSGSSVDVVRIRTGVGGVEYARASGSIVDSKRTLDGGEADADGSIAMANNVQVTYLCMVDSLKKRTARRQIHHQPRLLALNTPVDGCKSSHPKQAQCPHRTDRLQRSLVTRRLLVQSAAT